MKECNSKMRNFIVLLIFTVFISQSYAESSDRQIYVVKTSSTLNMRAEKSTQSAVVAKLLSGEKVIVSKIEGEWAQIDYNGLSGYVKTDYIYQSGEVDRGESRSNNGSFSQIFEWQVSNLPLGTWLIYSVFWLSVGGLLLNTIKTFNANAIHWIVFNVLTLIVLIVSSIFTIAFFYGVYNGYITEDQYGFQSLSGFWKIVFIMIFIIFIWIQQLFLFRNFHQWLSYHTEDINLGISIYPILFSFAAFLLAQIAGDHTFCMPTWETIKEDILYNHSFFDFLFALSLIAVTVGLIAQMIYLIVKLHNHIGYLLIALPVFILSYSSLLLISFFAALCALIFLIAKVWLAVAQQASESRDRARCCDNCKYCNASECSYGNGYISDSHRKICGNHEY